MLENFSSVMSRFNSFSLALVFFNCAQAYEASEYDLRNSKYLIIAIKMSVVAIAIWGLFSQISFGTIAFPIVFSVYLWHIRNNIPSEHNTHNRHYNNRLQLFWRFFKIGIMLAVVGLDYATQPPGLAPLMILATAWPCLIEQAKIYLLPQGYLFKALSFIDDCFASILPIVDIISSKDNSFFYIFSLIYLISSRFDFLQKNLELIAARVTEKIMYVTFFLLNNILKWSYMPQFLRRFQHDYLAPVAKEIQAVYEYMIAWRAHPSYDLHDIAEIANHEEKIYRLSPESLYVANRSGALPAMIDIPLEELSETALEKLQLVIRSLCEKRESVGIFLEKIAYHMPIFEPVIQQLLRMEQRDAILEVMIQYFLNQDEDKLREQIAVQLDEQNAEPIILLILDLQQNIEQLSSIIQNPHVQLGATKDTTQQKALISGLSMLFDKYLTFNPHQTHQAEQARQQLLVYILDKSYRCQDAIISLIMDESSFLTLDPVESLWVRILKREIRTAFHQLNVMKNELYLGLGYSPTIRQFKVDADNIEMVQLIESFIPGRKAEDQFEGFLQTVIQKHFSAQDVCSFSPISFSYSDLYILLLKSLSSEAILQELIQSINYQYLSAKKENSESDQHWLSRWEKQWQDYIDTAYDAPKDHNFPQLPEEYKARFIEILQTDGYAKTTSPALQREIFKKQIPVPQDYNEWSEYRQRHYFYQNDIVISPYNIAPEYYDEMIFDNHDQAVLKKAEEECKLQFIAPDFALLLLFNKKILESIDRPDCWPIQESGLVQSLSTLYLPTIFQDYLDDARQQIGLPPRLGQKHSSHR